MLKAQGYCRSAARPGAVYHCPTNMAGRGTDIVLGVIWEY